MDESIDSLLASIYEKIKPQLKVAVENLYRSIARKLPPPLPNQIQQFNPQLSNPNFGQNYQRTPAMAKNNWMNAMRGAYQGFRKGLNNESFSIENNLILTQEVDKFVLLIENELLEEAALSREQVRGDFIQFSREVIKILRNGIKDSWIQGHKSGYGIGQKKGEEQGRRSGYEAGYDAGLRIGMEKAAVFHKNTSFPEPVSEPSLKKKMTRKPIVKPEPVSVSEPVSAPSLKKKRIRKPAVKPTPEPVLSKPEPPLKRKIRKLHPNTEVDENIPLDQLLQHFTYPDVQEQQLAMNDLVKDFSFQEKREYYNHLLKGKINKIPEFNSTKDKINFRICQLSELPFAQ